MIQTNSARCIFLDRDGILNAALVRSGKPYPPKSIEGLKLCPKLRDIIQTLKNQYTLICITNQPDVKRKKTTYKLVEEINDRVKKYYSLHDLFCCYHDNADNCKCRKPKIGFFIEARTKYQLKLDESFMIGDRYNDIQAGYTAKCKTIFVDYKYNEKLTIQPNYVVNKPIEALKFIQDYEW